MRKICVLCAVILALGLAGAPAWAQGEQAQQPVFTYVALWGVPRAQWGDMEKLGAERKALYDSLVADGTLLGYGNFENRVHSDGGYTHGSWFQASSVGNILKALEKIYAQPGAVTAPVQAASKHMDYLMVANIHGSSAVTNSTGYLRVISAEIKPGQGDEFVAAHRRYLVPVYDKLLAEGTIVNYQLDWEYNIENAPGRFFSAVTLRNAEDLDKVRKAFGELFENNPAAWGALASTVVPGSRNDMLAYVMDMTHK
jgi:hypothetical protein